MDGMVRKVLLRDGQCKFALAQEFLSSPDSYIYLCRPCRGTHTHCPLA